MSRLKKLDTNEKYFKEDWTLIEKNFKENKESPIYKELKIQKEKKEKQKENRILITEYYYTTSKEALTNLLRVIIAKDRKVARVETIKSNTHIKKTIIELSNTLIIDFNLEDIFIFINKKNKNTIPNLLKQGFISLATEEDQEEFIPLMFERKRERTT